MKDEDLDSLFAQARSTAPQPTSDLMARVLADAMAVQRDAMPVSIAAGRVGLWSKVLAALGGGAGLAGLSTAMLAGLWVGFAEPAPFVGLASAFGSGTTVEMPLDQVDLLANYDSLLMGG